MNGGKRKVHFVGVGGIGMSGLAEILLNLGYDVSGSDLSPSEITQRLQDCGLCFFPGHQASNVNGAGILVVSAAVPADNPEIIEARRWAIPVIHRSDLLADLMRLKPHAVVVGGTHGKTTTTSMISAFLDQANIGATTIVGGILHRSGTNARWGTGDYLVAEADEHDGSFLRLMPTIAVVTSIDAEHLEYYGSLDNIKRAFKEFCNTVPFYGYSIICGDDPNCRSILPEIESVYLTFGLEEGVSLQGINIQKVPVMRSRFGAKLDSLRTRFDVVSHDDRLQTRGKLGTLEINTVGTHNIRNALAACSVGLCLGMRFPMIASGLRQFEGVRRRLQVRGFLNGITVVDDYAHHPTEIAGTLEAARWGDPKRVIVVFQPHLFSRTKFLARDFARELAAADHVFVTDIYASRESPMPGVDAGMIVDEARQINARHVELARDMNVVPSLLVELLEPGDTALILGAGSINSIVEPILQLLASKYGG